MKGTALRLWIKILFGIYAVLLIWIILFRLNFSLAGIHRVRELNLIPFSNYKDVYEGDLPIFEAILNILIFMPLGIYLRMLGGPSGRAFSQGLQPAFCLKYANIFFSWAQVILRI